MFVLSKIFQIIFKPGNFILFLILIGTALIWLPAIRLRRWGRWILTVTALFSFALASSSLADTMMQPLENRFPIPADLPAHIDGIVVLGGSIDSEISAARGQVSLTADGMRLTKAFELARLHPEARVVFTGGSGAISGGIVEGPYAQRFLADMGLDPARITIEDKSRNTFENGVYAKELIKPKPGETWILVTSAFHMPRAVGVFRKVGWNVIPYPVAYHTTPGPLVLLVPEFIENAGDIDYAGKEWAGLLAYWLLGRTSALFPAPEPHPVPAPQTTPVPQATG